MKITEFKAENIKKLKAIRIAPDQNNNLVIVGGNNAQGKTSVLDAIWYTVGGKRTIPEDVVRRGEELGETEITTDGDLVIYRKYEPNGKTKLEVTTKSGTPISGPQELLDGLVSKFSFDPLAFQKFDAKQQAAIVRDLCGVNTADLEEQIKAKDQERKNIGIEIKSISGQLDQKYRLLPEQVLQKIDTSALHSELDAIMNQAAQKSQAKHSVQLAQFEIQKLETEIEDTRRRYETLVANHKDKMLQHNALLERFNAIPEPPDATIIKARIAEASTINTQADMQAQRDVDRKMVFERQAEVSKLEKEIEALSAERVARIRGAQMPIQGLELTDEGLKFNGILFENCSSAEKLRVSVAMGIALNPGLKVLLIRDGSLLDDNSLASIGRMAAQHDAQVWIERVGKGSECSVIIEDGEVQGA